MARITAAQRKTATVSIETGVGQARLVQGLSRGLSVLRAFEPGDTSLSNAELAQRTALPKSTVSRLTQTLAGFGYLSYLAGAGRYALGPGVVALCHSLLASMPFRLAAKPVLQELANFSRLPASLGLRDGLDILYIETARRPGSRWVRFDLGARMPIETTAIGRAYLFALEPSERKMVLQRLRRERGRLAWRDIKSGLETAFDEITARGFCGSFGDWRGDVYGVAAPVTAGPGLTFAINCGGPPHMVARDFLELEMGPRLVAAADRIAKNLAASESASAK